MNITIEYITTFPFNQDEFIIKYIWTCFWSDFIDHFGINFRINPNNVWNILNWEAACIR